MKSLHLVASLGAVLASCLVIWIVGIQNGKEKANLSLQGEDDAPVVPGSSTDSSLQAAPKATIFSVELPPEGTYADRVEVTTVSSTEILGMKTKVTVNLRTESTRTVAEAEGGHALNIDTTVDQVSVSTTMEGDVVESTMSCDSANPADENSDGGALLTDLFCDPFYELVGGSTHFVVDEEDGTILEVTGDFAEWYAPAPVESSTTTSTEEDDADSSANPADKISPSSTVEQTSRLLEFLPGQPVEVGAQWDSSVDMGDSGRFEGTSQFVGFEDYNGQTCAVIVSTGSLELDLGAAGQYLGDEMGDLLDGMDMHLVDSTMTAKMYWDEEHKISRWSKTKVDMTLTMKNPVDGSTSVSIPVQETVELATDIED